MIKKYLKIFWLFKNYLKIGSLIAMFVLRRPGLWHNRFAIGNDKKFLQAYNDIAKIIF